MHSSKRRQKERVRLLKTIIEKSLIFLFVLVFIVLYYIYLSAIYLIPNNLEDKVSFVMILGFFTVIIGFFLFITLKSNLEDNSLFRFKCISEDYFKIVLLMLMNFAFLIPPIENITTVINWEQVNILNYIRAIIFIIGCSFLPGACIFEIFFHKNTLHERFKIESFFLKITLYPILSFTFIGLCVLILDTGGLLKEFFSPILFLIILGLFFFHLIIKKRRKDDLNLKLESLKMSKNTFIILIVALGVSLFALGISLSVRYGMKGDGWVGIGPANFIGKSQISPYNYGKDRQYPIFWGYIIFGLASLTGIPFLNTYALLAPFCYLSITSMYLFIKSILNKYDGNYSVLSTILITIYGGLFCFYPLIINNWGAISHYTFRSQFFFEYKTYAYILLYLSVGLFFIKSDEDFDITKKRFYRSEDFKLLFLSALFLIVAYITYMIPLIIGFYLIFLYCLFSDKNIKKKRFQSFKLYLVLIFVLFFIIDISLEFLFSRLYYIKYSRFIDLPIRFDKTIFTYLSFLGIFLFVSFIQLISTKYLFDRYKNRLKLNVNPKFIFIYLFSLLTIFVILNVYNILFIYYTYKYIFIHENYLYHTIFYVFLNIGIIGIIGIYLSYFCFKKYKNLFYFLISWIILSLSVSFYLLISYNFPHSGLSYRVALGWFNKYWFSAMPAFSILASIGCVEFSKYLNSLKTQHHFPIIFRNKNFNSIFKLTITSFLIITSYSNILIAGAYRGNTDEELTDTEANVIGWITENLKHDSSILIEKDLEIYTIISSFLDRDSCYYLTNFGARSGLFNINEPYLEQLDEIKRRNVEYAIFYDDLRGSLSDIDFIDNYLLPDIYTTELYRYNDLAVYYTPKIEEIGIYELIDYNGTYSFDKDEIGTEPLGWDASSSSIKVVGNYLCHRKIMQIFDYDSTTNVIVTQEFNYSQTFGTIEFWLFHSNPSDSVRIELTGDNMNGPSFLIGKNGWKYNNGYQYYCIPYIKQPSAYKWHHIRIDFECGNDGYLGLKPQKCRIIIDGINSGDLNFKDNPMYIENFNIETGVAQQEYENLYLDAIGYSWDKNYDIGDNKQKIDIIL